ADAGADAVDAGAEDLGRVVRTVDTSRDLAAVGRRTTRGAGSVGGELQARLALHDRPLVEHVEHVEAKGQTEVGEGELLLDAGVRRVHVLVAELVAADDLKVPVDRRRAVDGTAADPTPVRDGVPLAAGEAGRDVEAPRTVGGDLVHPVDVVRPLAVDVDGAESARAGARALQHRFTVTRLVDVAADVDDLVARHVPGPVLVREVAAQHPAVGQTLVEGQRRALVLLLEVAVVVVVAVAGVDARG